MTMDVGYIGRITKNSFQEINLDAVPTMYTLGGQTFANAWANSYLAACGTYTSCNNGATVNPAVIPVQPFFEAALGGASSAFCKAFTSCTAAVWANATNLSALKLDSVSAMWNNITTAGGASWVPGKTTIGQNGQATSVALSTSLGFSNYNALYVSYRVHDFHGITLQSNLTWSHALGTGEAVQATSSNTTLNPWNMNANYGNQSFDFRYIFNIIMYYQPPWFKAQHGIIGHLLGGWTISPLFQAQSGSGTAAGYAETGSGGQQAFGQDATPAASNSSNVQDAMLRGPIPQIQRLLNQAPVNGVSTNNPTGQNAFTDPSVALQSFRPCILGYDTSCGGYYNLRGLAVWNVDATISKDFSLFRENRVGATLLFQVTNILNHLNPSNPTLTISSPTTFGRETGTQFASPRATEFGLRIHF